MADATKFARKRKNSKKKEEAEESAAFEVGSLANGHPDSNTASNTAARESEEGPIAAAAAPATEGGGASKNDGGNTVRKKRGRPPKGSSNDQNNVELGNGKKVRPPATAGTSEGISAAEMKLRQLEHIKQQQAQAQAQSQGILASVPSPGAARSIIQATAMDALQGAPELGTAQGAASQHTAAFAATFSMTEEQKQQQQKNSHARGHGKTAVTTQTANQHPLQGTVAPHWSAAFAGTDGSGLPEAQHAMSPRTMAVLLRGNPSASEDMALSSLPLAAGGGVLTGNTVTGPAAGIVGGMSSQPVRGNAGKGPTTMGRPTKTHKTSKKSSNNKQVKRKGGAAAHKRKGSVSSVDTTAQQQQRQTRTVIVQDDDPLRLVNPLLDLPPPAVAPTAHHRQGSASAAGATGLVSIQSAAEPPPQNIMAASELQAWVSMVFPRPDTFPIAQYARWLGFHVPSIHEVEDIDSWIPPDSNSIPFEIPKDPVFYEIPPEGTFASRIWKAAYRSGDVSDDDAVLEGKVDPIYSSFLGQSESWTTAALGSTGSSSSSSSSPFKNILYHQSVKFKAKTPTPKRIQEILQQAQKYGILETSQWSLSRLTKNNPAIIAIANDATAGSSPSNKTANAEEPLSAEAAEAVPTASKEQPDMSSTVPEAERMDSGAAPSDAAPEETEKSTGVVSSTGSVLEAPKATTESKTGAAGSSRDSSSIWGFAAWHAPSDRNQPNLSMVLHYQLQWYQLPGSGDGPKLAELVMRIPFGPVPVMLGDENLTSPPTIDQDYFVEGCESKEERDRNTLPLRHRLIVILYALALEHARMCDVWYCLLEVPPSLVALLQKYLRMTPVPLESTDSSGAEPGSDTCKSFLVPMLCDLSKCSTNYALLLQQEILQGFSEQSAAPSPQKEVPTHAVVKERLIVQLPTAVEVKSAMQIQQPMNPVARSITMNLPRDVVTHSTSVGDDTHRQNKERPSSGTGFRGAVGPARHAFVRIQATLPSCEADPGSAVPASEKAAEPSVSLLPQEVPALAQPKQPTIENSWGQELAAPEGAVGALVVDGEATSKSAHTGELEEAPPRNPGADAGPSSQLSLKIRALTREGEEKDSDLTPPFLGPLHLDLEILKSFPVAAKPTEHAQMAAALAGAAGKRHEQEQLTSGKKKDETINQVLKELLNKQAELQRLESTILEPKVRSLLGKVIEERREYETSGSARKTAEEKKILEANHQMLERRREFDQIYQDQLDQDMDAVCEICNDGEVTPDNQILFCEACNVAVHQFCYGIERVPAGDYYCLACQYFGRTKLNSVVERQMRYQAVARAAAAGETNLAAIVQQRTPVEALPICCELCPVRNGAYVRLDNIRNRSRASRTIQNDGKKPDKSKWVHMVCAKWQGLNFVDEAKPDLLVEDVSDLKVQFRLHDLKCSICLGERGALNRCRFEGCDNWLHILCARMSGMCDVVHGENSQGNVEANPWTLLCPDHSSITFPDPDRKDVVPVHKLVLMAQSFPPEPKLDPRIIYANSRPDKPFNKLTGEERKQAFANAHYEQEVIEEVLKRLFGVRCEVCDQWEEDGKNLTRCHCCGVVFCDSCHVEGDNVVAERRTRYKCTKCMYESEMRKQKREKGGGAEEWEDPQCVVCCQYGGWLRKGNAEPVSKKVWASKSKKQYARSLFGHQLWCHCMCALWCAPGKMQIQPSTGCVDLSQVVLSNGSGFIHPKRVCYLCGNTKGLKEPCAEEDCCFGGDEQGSLPSFHPTCARQAGLEVKDSSMMDFLFYVKCYKHGGNEFNLRARMEDLLEVEVKRAGKGLANQNAPMTFSDTSRLLNSSILVMRMLGWAWRWSEWWVEHGSNWEPLLEAGQNEKQMTNEQLKIVENTRESRRDDARRCRLAALGAALRNRNYDVEDEGSIAYSGGFDHDSLDRALRAVLSTKSLVGPLEEYEIDFYAEWLGRAYRSKSRLLGFGDDKIEVGNSAFCRHKKDGSPKYELGARPLPGKQEMPEGQIFEAPVEEPDDFDVYNERVAQNVAEQESSRPVPKKNAGKPKKTSGRRGRPPNKSPPVENSALEENDIDEAELEVSVPRRRGRPPKAAVAAPTDEEVLPAPAKRGRPSKAVPEPVESASDILPSNNSTTYEEASAGRPKQRSSLPLRSRIERGRQKRSRQVDAPPPAPAPAEPERAESEAATTAVATEVEKTVAEKTEKGSELDTTTGEDVLAETATVETAEPIGRRRPGRPRKRALSPDPDEMAQDANEIIEQPKKRLRRKTLGASVSSPLLRKSAPSPSKDAPQSVVYDRVKKRARRKPDLLTFDPKQTNSKTYDNGDDPYHGSRRTSARQALFNNHGEADASNPDEDEHESSSDDDGDMPISKLVALSRSPAPDRSSDDGQEKDASETMISTAGKSGGEENDKRDDKLAANLDVEPLDTNAVMAAGTAGGNEDGASGSHTTERSDAESSLQKNIARVEEGKGENGSGAQLDPTSASKREDPGQLNNNPDEAKPQESNSAPATNIALQNEDEESNGGEQQSTEEPQAAAAEEVFGREDSKMSAKNAPAVDSNCASTTEAEAELAEGDDVPQQDCIEDRLENIETFCEGAEDPKRRGRLRGDKSK